MATGSLTKAVSVIMPAYRAETTLARAVNSVLAQTHPHWEVLIIADDQTDYGSLLAEAGIDDKRIRHLSTGTVGSGSSAARNLGLDAASFDLIAILDADDAFMPDKLELCLPHLDHHGVVSTALRVEAADGRFLKTVGEGADQVLSPGGYKFVNVSMDSMLVYDRRRGDARYDPSFPCLTDIEFLLKLLATNPTVFHIGTPLHVYTKQPDSVSNKPGAISAMIATKTRLSEALADGAYPLADEDGRAGLLGFYEASLAAEESFAERLAGQPGLLFEDHLAAYLAARQAQPI